MLVTLQINQQTRLIQATVGGGVAEPPPEGVEFVVVDIDSGVSPPKPYYVNGEFKYFYDGSFHDDPQSLQP